MSHNPPYYHHHQQNNQQQPQGYYNDYQFNHDLNYQNIPPPPQQGLPDYSVPYTSQPAPPPHQYPHQHVHPQLDYGIPHHPYPYPPPTGYPPPPQHQYQHPQLYQNHQSGSINPQNLGVESPFPPSPVPTPLPPHSQSVPVHPAGHIPSPGPSQSRPASATAIPLALKIKLTIPPKSTAMPRRSSDDYERARPSRSSRAQKVSYADDADEEEFDDPIEEEDDDEGDYQDHDEVIHKSSRTRRAPQRYAEDDFENKLLHTSPIKPKRNGRSSRSHVDEEYEAEVIPANTASRRKSFPPRPPAAELQNMFDDDDNGPPPPDTQETATDATPRKATRGKSRQSSEGSFEPDQSDAQSQTGQSESDDPIAGFIQDDNTEEDGLESDYGHPRQRQRQRQAPRRPKPRPAKRSTRSSARARNRRDDEEEDDDGIPFKKRLRERKSAVNYALPPADLSAEILQDAIATASRPGGSGRAGVGRANGVRFSGAAGKALPWSARGRDLAQAMGDPDTSDSVHSPNFTIYELIDRTHR
jgi:hypothetical protein